MQGVKIAVVVVALGAAGIIFWRSGAGGASLPDDPETATNWMCDGCQHEYSLTLAEYADAEERANTSSPLFCPACDQQKAYIAATCETCGRKYFGAVPGHSGACPICYPNEPVWRRPPQPLAPGETPKPAAEEAAAQGKPVRKKGPPSD